MTPIIHPIADELLADRAIEQFLLGYDPLLYAADLGLSPEQVFDQIRVTLRIYIEKSMAAEQKLRRPRAGRKSILGRPMTNVEMLQRSRAKKKKNQENHND